jgi:hypothetical protein
MAQSGFTPISIYYSATATNVPTAGNLVAGELAINTADGKLFYKDSSGVVQTLASKAGALGDVVGPASATDNALARFDATTGKLIQNSVGILSDAGALTGITDFTYTGTLTGGTGVVAIGTNQIYKTSAGIVGIGTATPATFSAYANLAVLNGIVSSSSGTDGGVYIGSTTAGTEIAYLSMGRSYNLAASGDTVLSTSAAKPLIFGTNNAERMRIDSSGLVQIGTSTAASSASALTLYRNSADTELFIQNSTTGTGSNGFRILATGNNVFLTNKEAGYMAFETSDVERMRIDSGGNVLVGKTSSSTSSGVGIVLASNGVIGTNRSGSTNTDTTMEVYSTGAANYRFYVGMGGTIFATSIVITAISDERLKENIKDIDTGIDTIMALKPRRFDWKEGKGQDKKNVAGFIAQEFETVFPECVSTTKAGKDGIEYKNINHETLIPTLVKAIQEQQALITNLTTRLNALEGK